MAASLEVERTIPMFRIFCVEKAKEFYVGFLGFAIDWEHRFGDNFPLYMQVRRGGLVLHLTEHHGDCCPGSAAFVEMRGVAAFQRELAAKDYRYLKPGLEDAPWGATLMSVIDPFGNKLLFSERKPGADA